VVVMHSRLRLRRVRVIAVAVVGLAALFAVYLRLALISNTNADAAGNSLQAWDMLHGNMLSATELVQLVDQFDQRDQVVAHQSAQHVGAQFGEATDRADVPLATGLGRHYADVVQGRR
jgi:hypothetical protein